MYMIGIIDYGVCNVGSIKNMLKKIGVSDATVFNDAEKTLGMDKIILPGVGSFDSGMHSLELLGFIPAIKEFSATGKPILGICLGMQLLGKLSEEGTSEGLGLIPMSCKRFRFPFNEREAIERKLKIPHMGWDAVTLSNPSLLTEGINGFQRYYFVHSYHAVCDNAKYEIMSCNYGYAFSAAVQNQNVYGVQFHPEKSHTFGMRLLKNFVEIC